MKKLISLALGCLMLCSCNMLLYPGIEKKWQTGRFKANTDNHIDDFINIDGYYMVKDTPQSSFWLWGWPFILYKDGSYGEIGFGGKYASLEGKRGIDLVKCINQEGLYHWIGGHYVLKNDTILVDLYYKFQLSRCQSRLKFKIIDRNKLLLVEIEEFDSEGPRKYARNKVLEFIPVSSLPSPETLKGIKRKRWMWENKEDWKAYKKAMKQKKKAMKRKKSDKSI